MGAWGTGISSNDTFEDIKDEFFELYNQGQESNEVSKKLIDSNQEIINAKEDSNNFWFALALCQWECKSLQPELLNRVTKIVQSGQDIELWNELGAEQSELTKRRKVLDNFLVKLTSEKKIAKKRKKKIFRDSIFQKGDCLTFKLENGNYGAAFVLESEQQTEYGMNLIAVCDYDSNERPNQVYFENANVFIRKEQSTTVDFEDTEAISWCYAQFYKKSQTLFELIGNLEVSRKYSFDTDYRRFFQWSMIPEYLNMKEELTKKHGVPKKSLKLKKLRKKTWL